MAATEPADFHQPQSTEYLYMDVFLQPEVLKTWRFVNLTFCKPDVSDVLKPDVLKPDVLKPDVFWVYRTYTLDSSFQRWVLWLHTSSSVSRKDEGKCSIVYNTCITYIAEMASHRDCTFIGTVEWVDHFVIILAWCMLNEDTNRGPAFW